MAFSKMITAMCDRCYSMADAGGQTQAIALMEAKREGWKSVKGEHGTRLLCDHCTALEGSYGPRA